MIVFKCTIYGACRTKKNSSRFIRPGLILPSKAWKDYEKVAIPQIKAAWGGKHPLLDDLCLSATFYRDRETGDLIGYAQGLCDALERAGVVENDRQIKAFDGTRMLKDADNPRVDVVLSILV